MTVTITPASKSDAKANRKKHYILDQAREGVSWAIRKATRSGWAEFAPAYKRGL